MAMASDEACQGKSTCSGSGSPQWHPGKATARISHQQLEHLTKAADHLAAAGLTDEADCVRGLAAEVREELIGLMTDNIAELQAEIAALKGDGSSEHAESDAGCDAQAEARGPVAMAQPDAIPAKQVAMNLKVVEVNLSDLRNLGFDIAILSRPDGENGGESRATLSMAQPAEVLGILNALQRENLAKVLAWPTVVTADGGSFEVKNQNSGAHLDVCTKLLDGNHVRVDIRPRDPQPGASAQQVRSAKRHEIDSRFEMELGKTAVLGGHVQERMKVEKLFGLKSSERRETRQQVRTFFLVTPELVDADPAVTAASHEESRVVEDGQRRARAIPVFGHAPGQPQPRVRYSFPAETR
jgi:hypothetical protein